MVFSGKFGAELFSTVDSTWNHFRFVRVLQVVSQRVVVREFVIACRDLAWNDLSSMLPSFQNPYLIAIIAESVKSLSDCAEVAPYTFDRH